MRELQNNLLREHFNDLESKLVEKFKGQSGMVLRTHNGEFKVKKFGDSQLTDLTIEDDKRIHHLFNPDGCNVRGRFIVEALVEVPESDGALLYERSFEINFSSTTIRYDWQREEFVVSPINVLYIGLLR